MSSSEHDNQQVDGLNRRPTFKRELGQNFLIDGNTLRIVAEAASPAEEDVVLEVGGGLGVLSQQLAPQIKKLHVVEIDNRLIEPLTDNLASHTNVQLHHSDALKLDLHSLQPQPNKLVANLPYGIAATLILKTVAELPSIQLWVAMVQKEVGQRFAAKPGEKLYGVPSVLAQLSCDIELVRKIPRSVFRPVPNVDSVLIRLTRRNGAPQLTDQYRRLVRSGFLHRRKALARSYQIANGGDKSFREQMLQALDNLKIDPAVRAERLTPETFLQIQEQLAVE